MREIDYVIGVDIGTQGVRGVAVTGDGTLLARAAVAFHAQAFLSSVDGRFEQPAEEWWHATHRALGQIGAQLAEAGILPDAGIALCVSGTSGTFVPLDEQYRPLRAAIMYSDSRAVQEADFCNSRLSALTTRLGYSFNTSFTLPKILWLAKHEPEIWARSRLIAHQADYLSGRLAGNWGVSDYNNVLKTGYDLIAKEYPIEITQGLEVPVERLPRVVASGTLLGELLPDLAAELRLGSHLLVVAGTTDGCASQFAAGVIDVGSWVSSLGTTLIIKGVSSTLIKDPQGRIYCHRHPEHGWLPGGASNTGGEVLARYFPGADLEEYDRRAAALVPTQHLAYPLVRKGERFPFLAPEAEGFSTAEAGTDEGYAAALEGVAFLERLAYDLVKELGAPVNGPIRTVGGGARSQLWLRIRASVCQRAFVVPAIADPAMGSAVLAAAGRLHPDLRGAAQAMIRISTEVSPEAGWMPVYEARYEEFREELRMRGYFRSFS